jgi:hypothetical protein
MANLAAFPTAKYFPKSGELLVFGNFPVNQLAEIYGTPMFVYDRAVLDLKYDAFRSALPERLAMYYCIKANPSLAVPIARKRSRSIGALGILAGNAIHGLRTKTLPASQELWKSLTLGKASRRVLQETFAIASQSLGWGLQLQTASKRQQLIITSSLSLQRGHVDSLPEDFCACFSGTGPPPESCRSAPGN